ncbi:hypothetical protein ACXZ9C_11725 [Streptococcus agalactiae]
MVRLSWRRGVVASSLVLSRGVVTSVVARGSRRGVSVVWSGFAWRRRWWLVSRSWRRASRGGVRRVACLRGVVVASRRGVAWRGVAWRCVSSLVDVVLGR